MPNYLYEIIRSEHTIFILKISSKSGNLEFMQNLYVYPIEKGVVIFWLICKYNGFATLGLLKTGAYGMLCVTCTSLKLRSFSCEKPLTRPIILQYLVSNRIKSTVVLCVDRCNCIDASSNFIYCSLYRRQGHLFAC